MLLSTTSTDTDIVAAYVKGANYYDISEQTRLSLEEVAAIIERAEANGLLSHGTPETSAPVAPVAPTAPVQEAPVAPVEPVVPEMPVAPEAPVQPEVPVVSEVTPPVEE